MTVQSRAQEFPPAIKSPVVGNWVAKIKYKKTDPGDVANGVFHVVYAEGRLDLNDAPSPVTKVEIATTPGSDYRAFVVITR